MATLSSRRPGHRLLNRAPPPTPIATAKGVRSAVVDDVVFSEYLESSLRIPKLALPRTYSIPSSRSVSPSSSGSRSPLRRLPAVDLMALRERDGDAIRMLLAAAEEIGAFRVEGHGVNRAEVRSAVDAVRGGTEGGFLLAGEKNRELAGRCYGHGRTEHGIAVEELRWFRPMRPEDDSALQQLLPPDSYRVLRDKLENIFDKLESVAKTVSEVIVEHCDFSAVKKGSVDKLESHICLRRYDFSHCEEDLFDSGSETLDYQFHALKIHISLKNHEFCIHSQESSYSFFSRAGSVVVTFGDMLQEYFNPKFKCATSELMHEPSNNQNPLYSLEFMCTPLILHKRRSQVISLLDQILITAVIAFLYIIWSRFT